MACHQLYEHPALFGGERRSNFIGHGVRISRTIGRDAVIGGTVGAAVTLCGPCAEGAGAVAANVVSGALTSGAENAVNQYYDQGWVSKGEVLTNAFFGGIASGLPFLGVGYGVGGALGESDASMIGFIGTFASAFVGGAGPANMLFALDDNYNGVNDAKAKAWNQSGGQYYGSSVPC